MRLKFSWGKRINLDPRENVHDFEKRIEMAILMSNDGPLRISNLILVTIKAGNSSVISMTLTFLVITHSTKLISFHVKYIIFK